MSIVSTVQTTSGVNRAGVPKQVLKSSTFLFPTKELIENKGYAFSLSIVALKDIETHSLESDS